MNRVYIQTTPVIALMVSIEKYEMKVNNCDTVT